jgi:hypothetical protein
MDLKKCFLVLIAALRAISTLAAETYDPTYFEAGVEFLPYLTYGNALDSSLSGYYSTYRLQLVLDVHLGKPITRGILLIGGYDGMADEIFQNGIFVNQITSSLFSLGLRVYPLVTGLVLGADAGISILNGFDAVGYGVAGTIAWDFSPLGLNCEVGAKTLYLSFGSSSPPYMFAVMPFVAMLI